MMLQFILANVTGPNAGQKPAGQKIVGAIAGLTLFSGMLVGCSTQTPSAQTSPTSASTATTAQTPASEQQVVRIGYVRWGLLPIIRERKVLEQELAKQNIRVEWVGPFPAFAPVLEAFRAGEVDISSGGDIPGISGLVGGTPVCIIGYQAPIPEAEAVLVRADSTIQSPKDLVGKKVAVNRGGWGEHLLLRVLAEANVPKEQVERVYLSPTDALPAVTQGHVDAWSVWEPNVSIAEVEHDLRPIASGEAASHYGIYVVNTDILAAKPTVVRAVLDAIASEATWAANNPQEAAKAFGSSTELAEPVVQQLGKDRLVDKLLPLTPAVIADIQTRADWMYEQKAIPKQIDIRQTICPATAGLETYTNIAP
jgi:sulfonate transport system substrate-binding protein